MKGNKPTPCTAMVFVWSYLTRGDAGYTLIQVAINDLVLIFAYAPIVGVLVEVPVMLTLVRIPSRTRKWWPADLRCD